MNYLSVCSGIEAASVAFHPYEWKPVAFSEIDKAASRVLAHHHPEVPNWGDMTKFQEWPDAAVDVLCGGTPCQSFSVAGLRQGLADPRGNLMLTFGAIAARYRPRWLVWENVPGVLSSNGGRDFGAFLGMLGQLGYGVAYRVLDAQYVRTRRFPLAVPQRRRRVFVVGYLGDWRRAAAVLFDRESLSGHPAPRRKAGQGFTRSVAPSLTGSGRGVERAGETRGQDPVLAIQSNSGEVGYCLTATAQQSLDAETETLIAVAHALRGEGFDASEDGTGRGTPIVPVAGALCRDTFSGGASGRPESAAAGHFIPVAIQERAISENPASGPDGAGVKQDGSAYMLEARTVPQAVAFVQNTRDEVRLMGGDGSIAGALAAEPGAKQQCYVAFDCKGTEVQTVSDGSHPTLRSMGHANSHQNAGGHAAVAFDLRGREGGAMPEGPHETANIRAASGGSSRSYVAQPWAVRRLTPRECERLQGFHDDYTLLADAAKPQADGPRYKQIGNSWAVNCIDWIAERIEEVDGWK